MRGGVTSAQEAICRKLHRPDYILRSCILHITWFSYLISSLMICGAEGGIGLDAFEVFFFAVDFENLWILGFDSFC